MVMSLSRFSLIRAIGRPIERQDKLGRQVAVVADFAQCTHDLCPVEVAPAQPAGGCCRQRGNRPASRRRLADRLDRVGLFDVDVKGVENDAEVVADLLAEQQRLVVPVDEVGLEAVERLDARGRCPARRHTPSPPSALRPPMPTPQRVEASGRVFPTVEGTMQKICPPSRFVIEALLDVLDAARGESRHPDGSDRALEHHRHAAPALELITIHQSADLVGVIARRLAADLDPVIAKAVQPLSVTSIGSGRIQLCIGVASLRRLPG
jgi:hypothetical protein